MTATAHAFVDGGRVDTASVTRRVTSPTLIGRAGQLDTLRTATSAGQARIVLISGDAGIGKTRLVAAAVGQARADGLVTAVGGCVQLGEVSVAFAPLVEALRDLRADLGDAELDELLDTGAVTVKALLDGNGAPSQGSGPLFEHLLGFLTRLGRRRRVLLVFEDLHWADASTRDLVAFLGRNLRDAPVTLALTYRDDELHRRHPLRPLVNDLERDPRVERVALTGLGRAELTGLLGEICDEPPPADVIDDLLARSGGNPFYVEEMVASGGLRGGLPDTLAEIILGRVSRLSEPAQAMLHAAAVVDDDVDDELLAEATGQPLDAVTSALREAVLDQLLLLDGASCRFRHALVREALYDDLLPGERTRLHVATAHAVERSGRLAEHVRWAMAAHHWDAARNVPKAFAASVRAGLESENVHAFADAAAQYERALRLRDQVPDAEQSSGMTHADLLLRAADAVQTSSRAPRGLVLAEAALAVLGDDAPPERRALACERIGRINWVLHHGAAAVAAYERAAELVAGRPPSREQAFALSALGQSLMLRNLFIEATTVLQRAIAVAAEVDAPDVEGHAQCSLGPCLVGAGRIDDGLAAMRRALELSHAAGITDDVSRAYTNLQHSLYSGGRYDEALPVAAEALDYVIRSGHAHHYGEAIAGNAIAALFCSGRWNDAARIYGDARIPTGDPYQELRWLPLLLAAGRYDEARARVQDTLAATAEADDVQFRAAAFLRAAELAAVERRWDDARRLTAGALELAARTDDQFYRAFGYGLALRIEADRCSAAQDRRDGADLGHARAVADRLLAETHQFTAQLAERDIIALPEPRGWLVAAEAEHARAYGRDDAQTWGEVAASWEDIGQPWRVATARYRQADALLRARGDRTAAATLARQALAVAESLGAEPLAADVRQLAQRGRLDLTDRANRSGPANVAAADPAARLNVTRRELDVLRLLADGQTNRQIGQTLFISEKTASVHVTNLLRKLGVPNRVEAAAVAQRAGLT
ncbi:MAG: helix-turn-helix transcriptional regulator [Pseudonocardiales bacterium]|nr:helix-turn-helix transcriptional regulator [Pseudonocardiales bacterium]